MKRKAMLLVLTLCTVFSISACQSDNKVDDSLRGTIESVASIDPIALGDSDALTSSTDNSSADALSTENANADALASTGSDTENADSATSDTDAGSVENSTDTSATISLGHTESNTYESTFLGIGCKFDKSWTFMSDDQIKENNKMASELIDNKAISNALESGSILTDMMVQNTTTGSNTSIAIEKLHSSMKDITEEEYIDIVTPQMVGTLESAGFSNVITEKVTVTFTGKECYALKITSSVNKVAVNQLQIPIRKGDYMACVTLTSFGDSTVDEMLTAFYTLN